MSQFDIERGATDLLKHVLTPLVLGGTVVPLPHVAPEIAPELVKACSQIYGGPEAAQVDLVRVRKARELVPVDTIPPPDPGTWGMLIAFSNVLRASDPENFSIFHGENPTKFWASAEKIIGMVRPMDSVMQVVARHTVLDRILDVRRRDTKVSWWCGSETFRGRSPSHRLMAWPELRRVHVDEKLRPLEEVFGDPLGAVDRRQVRSLLARLLDLSPITNFARIQRKYPKFWCGPQTAAWLADRSGCRLTVRVLVNTMDTAVARKALVAVCPADKLTDELRRAFAWIDDELKGWGEQELRLRVG